MQEIIFKIIKAGSLERLMKHFNNFKKFYI